jgi:predicted nucleic acid-binding protein
MRGAPTIAEDRAPELAGDSIASSAAGGRIRDGAFELACRHRRGIYAALFVVVALGLGAKLITADRRLHDALAGNPAVGDALLWVGDVAIRE